MRRFRAPVMILCFIISPLILLFNIIFGPYGFQLNNMLNPQWVTAIDQDGYNLYSSFQQLSIRISYILIIITLLLSAFLFLVIGVSQALQKNLNYKLLYIAIGLLFIEPFLWIINLTIENITYSSPISWLANCWWQFAEDYIGPSQISGIFRPINYISGLITHFSALTILVISKLDEKDNLATSLNFGVKGNSNSISNYGEKSYKYKYCPFCAETILVQAILCKHCKSKLN